MTASMAGHAPVHRPHGPSGSRSAQRWPAPALHPAMPPRIVEAFELKAAAVRHDASLPAWLARIGLTERDRCRIIDGAGWLAGHWYVGGRCWWRLKASQTSHASRSQCAQRTSPSASFPLALYLIQRAAHVPPGLLPSSHGRAHRHRAGAGGHSKVRAQPCRANHCTDCHTGCHTTPQKRQTARTFPSKPLIYLVGDSGIEPLTPSV